MTEERNKTLEEVAQEFDKMKSLGDTSQSFAAYVRNMKTLAQPEQEPVVWMYVNKSTHEVRFQKHMRDFVDHGAFSEVPLFSEPLANQLKTSGSPIAQRKPLTDEEIRDALEAEFLHSDGKRNWQDDLRVARAIEAAHGIGEKK